MTQRRREMMLRICDGDAQVPFYLFHLNRFRRCDQILKWLIANRLTGRDLVTWVKFHHEGSILKAGAFVIMKLEKEGRPRSVIADEDFLRVPAPPIDS